MTPHPVPPHHPYITTHHSPPSPTPSPVYNYPSHPPQPHPITRTELPITPHPAPPHHPYITTHHSPPSPTHDSPPTQPHAITRIDLPQVYGGPESNLLKSVTEEWTPWLLICG
ncbi:hypothetical protein Pmani_034880 [Petrolisthes manimaculis]|uniref:Uncharacterized protein n=1 Tax=Petrolisthes manimaculis TaxID=1843537 RepID=A0AAE1NP28_9EUCA|nr:hypothetical protein Pmani_034880 [Petrolisthes manimaculis]